MNHSSIIKLSIALFTFIGINTICYAQTVGNDNITSIDIPLKFSFMQVGSDAFVENYKNCTDTLPPNFIKLIDSNAGFLFQNIELTDPKNGNTLLIKNKKAACIYASGQGYPILPLEVLQKAISFQGADSAAINSSLIRTLQRLAIKGNSITAYQLSDQTWQIITLASSKKKLIGQELVRYYVKVIPTDSLGDTNADEVITGLNITKINGPKLNAIGAGYINIDF